MVGGGVKVWRLASGLTVAVAFALFVWHAARFFPNPQGLVGADYSWFFPTLVAGDFWFQQNGLLHVPYFTPAFCGGAPLLANPQSVVYSVPQLLLAFTDPVKAVWGTLLIFGGLGALGSYLLLVRCFRASSQAGALAATLFLFNGFMFYRVVMGHLPYHAFGLVPVLACVILSTQRIVLGEGRAWRRLLPAMILGGTVIAYVTYSGALNFQVPVILTVVSLLLMMQVREGLNVAPWLVLGGSAMWGVFLSAAKLVPAAVLARQFPRPYIPFYLFHNPVEQLRLLFEGLFLPTLLPDVVRFGAGGVLGRHEFELGLSLVPLLLILLAAPRFLRIGHWRNQGTTARLQLVVLAAVFCLPLLLTFGPWRWGLVLLHVPVINSNTTLVRWWSIYLIPIIVVAALCLDRLARTSSRRTALLALCAALALAQQVGMSQAYYEQRDNTYDPAAVLAAFQRVRSGVGLPAIEGIDSAQLSSGSNAARREHLNDPFTHGKSSWPCYEPLFGYSLELAPELGIKSGPIEGASAGGSLNLVDPATYLEEESASGRERRFGSSRLEAAHDFAAYREYPWPVPLAQRLAQVLTLLSLTASVGYGLVRGLMAALALR